MTIGGAVALNNPEQIIGEVRDRLPPLVMTNVPDVQLTTLGDDVVVKGALASAITGGSDTPQRKEKTTAAEDD